MRKTDFHKDTATHYLSESKASQYHHAFTEAKGLNGFRFRLIAEREKKTRCKVFTIRRLQTWISCS